MLASRCATRPYRRLAAVVAAASIASLIAGCSSSPGKSGAAAGRRVSGLPATAATTSSDPVSSDASVSAPPRPSGAPGDTPLATFVFDEQGAKVTTEITAGQPFTVPEYPIEDDVLDGCKWHYQSVLDTSVFVAGEVTITYDGTIPDEIGFDPQLFIRQLTSVGQLGAGEVGKVEIADRDDHWHCGGDGDRWQERFEPGESSQSFRWYAALPVRSNAQPTASEELKRSLAINWFAYGIPEVQFPNKPQATVSGPHAARCKAKGDDAPVPTLLLYAAAPVTFDGTDVNGDAASVRCSAA